MRFLNYIKQQLGFSTCDDRSTGKEEGFTERSDAFIIQYEKWIKAGHHIAMLNELMSAFELRKDSCRKRDNFICFVAIPMVHGFTMYYTPERWEREDFQYFAEFLKDYLQHQFQYECCSTTENNRKQGELETTERHSLRSLHTSNFYPQILIRLSWNNHRIKNIKVCLSGVVQKEEIIQDFLGQLKNKLASDN